ncbi:hypothetical protein ES703_111682 [subsurface metagenome]
MLKTKRHSTRTLKGRSHDPLKRLIRDPISYSALFPDPRQIQQKRIVERGFPVTLVPTGSTAVSGLHIGFQHEPVLVGLKGPEFGNPLRRFPVLDL